MSEKSERRELRPTTLVRSWILDFLLRRSWPAALVAGWSLVALLRPTLAAAQTMPGSIEIGWEAGRYQGGTLARGSTRFFTGKAEVEVDIDKEQFKSVFLAEAIVEAEGLVTLTHFKLHELSGFGGALKNLGMGCASRKGKLSQHSNIAPAVNAKKCTGCGDCVVHCAQEAIGINPETEKAVIDPKKCVGCAECILVCPYGNIQIQWNESIPVFLKKMMEYASGVMTTKRDRGVFISFITQVSPACDCYGHNDLPIVGDLGILASRDPVAIDQACADLVLASPGLAGSCLQNLSPGADKFKEIYPQVDWPIQLEYAEKLGLGSREYELVKV